MKYLLMIASLASFTAFNQIVHPEKQPKTTSDTARIAYLRTPVKNMRVVQFGIETGTQFVRDSAQLSRLGKNNLFHYGLNLQIGDLGAQQIYTLIGCDFYVSNGYQKTSDSNQFKEAVWGVSGNFGVRVPIPLSKLTAIHFGPSLLVGRHGVAKSNVNTFGIRLAASLERRLGTVPCIGYLGIAYDNNLLYRRDKSLVNRDLNQLRVYFGLRF